MAVVDRNGLPISVGIAGGAVHETQLVEETLDASFAPCFPSILIGDKAYDSDILNKKIRVIGVEMVSPNRLRRRVQTQDGRRLRRYKRRWKVERIFSRIQKYCRLAIRWEWKADNFMDFLQPGCMRMLLTRL